MRKISMAAVSALALLTTSAHTQQSPSADTTPRSTTPAYSPAAAPKAPAQNPLKQEDVSKIEGTSVLAIAATRKSAMSQGC